jgi:hypothetical protein
LLVKKEKFKQGTLADARVRTVGEEIQALLRHGLLSPW